MRKSALIKELDEIVEKNGILFTKCRELETAINEKDALILELESKIELLTAENEQLKNTASSIFKPVSEEVKNNMPSDTTANEAGVAENKISVENSVTELEKIPETENETEEEIPCDSAAPQPSTVICTADTACKQIIEPTETAMKLASEAIGRVVLKSAQLCNDFAAEGNQNSKDLINLALGRTEVFKSEALSLVSTEEMSDERFEAELRSREAAVNEYFELLSRQ